MILKNLEKPQLKESFKSKRHIDEFHLSNQCCCINNEIKCTACSNILQLLQQHYYLTQIYLQNATFCSTNI